MKVKQTPECGQAHIKFRGDRIRFTLESDFQGMGFIRTNIGHADLVRREIIQLIEEGKQRLGEDWFDIPMVQTRENFFELTLPLLEVGHFQAKAYLLPAGKAEPVWPEGGNVTINVEPDWSRSGNTIYCAFTRQFGRNKTKRRRLDQAGQTRERQIAKLEKKGYSVIPPSGTFRDLIAELDHIFDQLNCRILHLLPVHPTPTVYGRMGRFGSPYAAQDFTAVDPALAQFDPAHTPLDQFRELVDAVHRKEGRLFIDIALNHTGWAAKLHETHPEWIRKNQDGTFHRPGAWGIVWGDLTELEHTNKELWLYLAEVLLTWCRRGVDGFRCDAGYMIPELAWTYLVARVREEFPDTVFLLEGLGGDPEITRKLIDSSNLNWAYSELFQNYSREEITHYMRGAWSDSARYGCMVHYAETHDNNRLASVSKAYARMRVALCALLSSNGAFGFANGVEWLADEKIDVHLDCGLNWGADENLVAFIGELNDLLNNHPCFKEGVQLEFLPHEDPELLIFKRSVPARGVSMMCAFNLSAQRAIPLEIDREGYRVMSIGDEWNGNSEKAVLAPNHFVCLETGQLSGEDRNPLAAMAQDVVSYAKSLPEVGRLRAGQLAADFGADPVAFCERVGRATLYHYPHDLNRQLVLPSDHFLVLMLPNPFHARFRKKQLQGIVTDNRMFVAVFEPLCGRNGEDPAQSQAQFQELEIVSHGAEKTESHRARVFIASPNEKSHPLPVDFQTETLYLGTNRRGGMCRANVSWGRLASRYDALLASNLDSDIPEDRHVFLRRWRCWVRYCGHSAAVAPETTESVYVNNHITYTFAVPVGTGKWIRLKAVLRMLPYKNVVLTEWFRDKKTHEDMLDDHLSVELIVRPDIEDRSFHELTKAYQGPERDMPRRLKKRGSSELLYHSHTGSDYVFKWKEGRFVREEKWLYHVHYPLESGRGLDDRGDVFSPGYFTFNLRGNNRKILAVGVRDELNRLPEYSQADSEAEARIRLNTDHGFPVWTCDQPLLQKLKTAMTHFLVKRGDLKTVIAGYPWFLDWGRDTLICARGILAAGYVDDVMDVLLQFGRFSSQGTLPNMIHGENASNRDTSDAPLWFFVVCKEVCDARKDLKFLDQAVDEKRTVKQVLIELADGYLYGTPNGIRVDARSGLVFSPSHFTWMDTNYPAGTPREGYPVEIQALWYQALSFLAVVTKEAKWRELAERVKSSFNACFWMEERGYLSDCLYASGLQSPAEAKRGDALRPNQVFALMGDLVHLKRKVRVLDNLRKLVVPGGLRSLADQPVEVALPVRNREGQLINDPHKPFWPRYEGSEDARRKPAYHNGTAWTWPFPSFCEALFHCYGESCRQEAKAYLLSSLVHFNTGCVNQMPEILDGASPHQPRGCDAQAWSVTEFYRVLKLLQGD